MKFIDGGLADLDLHTEDARPAEVCTPRAERSAAINTYSAKVGFGYLATKRAMDVLGAFSLLLIFLPVILIVPLCIRSDGGPVLFRQKRLGKNGKPFEIFKFRTMAVDAEERLQIILDHDQEAAHEWKCTHKLKGDPRITAVGQFLRKTSLDELPQLINILKGDMSLVGPRPIVDAEREKYGKWFVYYAASLPGLTGLWQVTGRNDISYTRRVALDRRYACYRSLWLDVKIILKTPWAMFAKRTGH